MRSFRVIVALSLAIALWAAKPGEWQDLRGKIKTGLHVPDPLPALRDKGYGQLPIAQNIVADRISYATGYDMRVPALVYHAAGATVVQHPALVVVNGEGDDKSARYAYWAGILYARAGAVVLTYDAIGEYERNSDRRSGVKTAVPEDMALRTTGLMVTDVMQAVQYLASRKDVDPKRIAVVGFSQGAFVSSLACALDEDIHACVLAGGGKLDYGLLNFVEEGAATIFALNARRGPTLMWDGSAEQDFVEKLRAGAVARLGSSKEIFQYGLTADGGHQAYFLARPVALWLNEKLKFPNWTKKQIEAAAETDWQGFRVLGDKMPALRREDLKALPDVVWNAEKDAYVYESWVERAKGAEAGPAALKVR